MDKTKIILVVTKLKCDFLFFQTIENVFLKLYPDQWCICNVYCFKFNDN